ncbi:MAG TPA: glycosyl hydrolase family 28-related protein [Opitutaceae bacterium]|nr:glycosyl hydrolase family 28-related protein [Opitutaceae bacterium]
MSPRPLVPLLAFAAVLAGRAAAPAAPPAAAPAAYNVRSFGAAGDGATKDTAAFQKALDACAVNGGGEVVVPAGRYLIGSIQLGEATVLRLEEGSVLLGSSDLGAAPNYVGGGARQRPQLRESAPPGTTPAGDYPMTDVRWEGRAQIGRRGLIYAVNVEHVGIVGPGQIIGTPSGTNDANDARNPVVVEFVYCRDVRWEGFSVVQGGNWATHPTYCSDVVIRHVKIRGNRDGIDVDSCRHVRIEDCDISTGDDSISLKSGRGMDGARLAKPCEDVVIAGCTLEDRNFACLGIGSEISGGVRDIRIERCKLVSPRSAAIYIKTRIGRAGVNENIAGDDLDVEGQQFLRINLTRGGNSSTRDDPVEGLVGYPVGRNFSFSHIRVKCGSLVQATEISAKRPLQGLRLSDITGTCSQGGITLANVQGAELSGIRITGLSGPLLGTVAVTGTGLEGAVAIPAPVDPPPGNAQGGPRRLPRRAPPAVPPAS